MSLAFDLVNTMLLIKRLRIFGLPGDLVELISNGLRNGFFYVSVDRENSCVQHCDAGTVQGLVLGPIQYAIYVSPLSDLAKMTLFR